MKHFFFSLKPPRFIEITFKQAVLLKTAETPKQ